MGEADYKQMIHNIFNELLRDKKYEMIDDYFTNDIIFYDGKLKFLGREALKKNIVDRRKAIPDLTYVLDDVIISGNKAAIRWHGKGNAVSDFADFKAGTPVRYWGLSMCELKEGKIVKNWEVSTAVDAIPQS